MCRSASPDNAIAAAIMSAVDAVDCRRAAELNPDDAALWKIIARYQSLRARALLSGAADTTVHIGKS